MLTLSCRQIHERLAAHVVATLLDPTVPGPWRESRIGHDMFPSVDSSEIEHHGFAIGIPSSTPDPDDRQRNANVKTTSVVSIRWGHFVRAEGTVLDTHEALDAELELTAAVRRVETNPALHVDVLAWNRALSRDGLLFLGELVLRVVHHVAI